VARARPRTRTQRTPVPRLPQAPLPPAPPAAPGHTWHGRLAPAPERQDKRRPFSKVVLQTQGRTLIGVELDFVLDQRLARCDGGHHHKGNHAPPGALGLEWWVTFSILPALSPSHTAHS
jgi:hypothetical protein